MVDIVGHFFGLVDTPIDITFNSVIYKIKKVLIDIVLSKKI